MMEEWSMKGILFDFNGTLFNDTHLHRQAWHSFFLKNYGWDLSDEEIMRRCLGPSNDDIFKDFFEGRLSKAEVDMLAAQKEMEYRSVARADPENLHLIEGAPQLLDLLVEKQIPFALATASPIENIRFYLEDLGLKKWFDLERIVYEEGKLPSKPDPAFYIEAAQRIGLTPSECMIVEDSPTGIRAAINAHAGQIIAIDRTARREWLEQQPEISAIIHDFWGFERYL